jgi:hypothetical protein
MRVNVRSHCRNTRKTIPDTNSREREKSVAVNGQTHFTCRRSIIMFSFHETKSEIFFAAALL